MARGGGAYHLPVRPYLELARVPVVAGLLPHLRRERESEREMK